MTTCRECGCTEQDCAGCIERTGGPCWWVEQDLCSACVPDKVQALRLLAEHAARSLALGYQLLGAIVIVSDPHTNVQASSFLAKHASSAPIRAIAALVDKAMAEQPGYDVKGGQLNPELVTCVYCGQEVVLAETAAVRTHNMTCSESPAVQELTTQRAEVTRLLQCLKSERLRLEVVEAALERVMADHAEQSVELERALATERERRLDRRD